MVTPDIVKPITLGGGIYLQSRQFNRSTHIDQAHLLQINQRSGEKPTNLGVVEYFIQSGYMEDMGSVYDFGKFGKNRVPVTTSNGLYTWEQREAVDDFYIVEDLSNTDRAGIDGQAFKLRMNRRAVGNNTIMTCDKFAQYDLLVTQDEIVKDGDTWVYTVVAKGQNIKDTWYPKTYLTPLTRYVQKSTVHGANTTVYSDLGEWGSRTSQFYNWVGNYEANLEFVVGGNTSGMKINREEVVAIEDFTKVVEMWVFKAGSAAMDMQLRGEDPIKKIYKGNVDAAQKDVVGSAWLSAVEALAIKRIELDLELEAYWGTGGTITLDGYTYNSPIGLYHQFNRGNQHFYSIQNLTLDRIDGILASFFAGRTPSFGTKVFELTVGEGMASLLRQLTKGLAAVNGMITNSDRFLIGDTNNLHFKTPVITAYDFSFGTVKWTVNPALNPIEANDSVNPYVGNYRLSSYMAIVIDIMGEDNNIQELYNANGWDFVHQYKNGKGNYLGSPIGFPGDMNLPYDFKVAMRKKHKAYRLVDPTRSFILKPYHPVTGKPFGNIE